MIEDDLAIAQMYQRQLALDGFRVLLARDGKGGLDLVRSSRPELILLDVLLPGIQGFELLDVLHKEPALASIPVLILSNYGDPEMQRGGLVRGAREYLIKSSTAPSELSAHVRRWIGSASKND